MPAYLHTNCTGEYWGTHAMMGLFPFPNKWLKTLLPPFPPPVLSKAWGIAVPRNVICQGPGRAKPYGWVLCIRPNRGWEWSGSRQGM